MRSRSNMDVQTSSNGLRPPAMETVRTVGVNQIKQLGWPQVFKCFCCGLNSSSCQLRVPRGALVICRWHNSEPLGCLLLSHAKNLPRLGLFSVWQVAVDKQAVGTVSPWFSFSWLCSRNLISSCRISYVTLVCAPMEPGPSTSLPCEGGPISRAESDGQETTKPTSDEPQPKRFKC